MLTFSIQLKPAESCSASNVHLRSTGCVLWNWRTEQLQRLSKDSDSSLHSKGDGVHIGTVLKSGTHAMSAGTAVVAKGVGEVTSPFHWGEVWEQPSPSSGNVSIFYAETVHLCTAGRFSRMQKAIIMKQQHNLPYGH